MKKAMYVKNKTYNKTGTAKDSWERIMSNIAGISPQQLLANNQQNLAAAAQKKGVSTATGNLSGRNVTQVKTQQSLIDSAAEELTTSLESESSDEFAIKERKRNDTSSDSRFQAVQEYAELIEDKSRPKKMDELVAFLRGNPNKEDALQQTLYQFSNKTDAWAALAEIAQTFGKESPQPAGLETVLDTMESLEQSFGTEIKAGLRGALNSAGFTDIGSAAQLRDLYTATLTITTTPESVLARLMEEYEDESDLDRAIDFLFSTIGSDLTSGDPSMDTVELQNLVGTLEKTQQLHSSHKLCTIALNRWKGQKNDDDEDDDHDTEVQLTPLLLMKQLIGLRNENFVSSSDIDKIAQQGKPETIEREVLLLQEILNAVRKFPVLVFDSVDNRMKVMGAAQEAVDEAIRKEDEYLYELEHPDIPKNNDQ